MGGPVILKKIARRILSTEIEQLTEQRDSLLRTVDQLRPIDRHEPEDVFIAGYPKSGNTWLQLLVAALMYRCDPSSLPDSLVQDLVPDVHYKSYYKRFLDVTCFKTHGLPRADLRRVINIVRDGRDVACSYKSFNQALGAATSIDDIINGNAELSHGDWQSHVLAWKENPFDAEILLVRYEDMKSNCVEQLDRIAKFLKLDVTEQELARLDQSTRVDRMKAREKNFGWDNKNWPADQQFVRRGVSGSFREEMTEAQIQEFNRRYGDTLRLLGYSE